MFWGRGPDLDIPGEGGVHALEAEDAEHIVSLMKTTGEAQCPG